MKAVILEQFNTPFVIKDVDTPDPGKGEVRVRIMACGINPLDLKIKAGQAAHAKTGEGFDIVYDTVGGTTLDDSFRGATYSGVFTLLPLLSGKGRDHHGHIMQEATALIEAGKLKPLMDSHHYTMATVEEAYAALGNRTARGKLVVEIT